MTADLPNEVPLELMQINYCITEANREFPNVTPLMIKVVLGTEGGQIGTIRKNSNGSYDLGPMQVNTTHLVDVYQRFGYTAKDLVYNLCKNMMVGAWQLNKHLEENEGKAWVAIGNYHSKTPSKRRIYLQKAVATLERLMIGMKSGREAEALGRSTNWGQSPQPLTRVPSLAALESAIAADPGLVTRTYASSSPRPPLRTSPETRVVTIDTRQKKLRFID